MRHVTAGASKKLVEHHIRVSLIVICGHQTTAALIYCYCTSNACSDSGLLHL